MAGSTSPSSLIQTACFFGVEISAFEMSEESFKFLAMESVVAPSSANVNVARIVKRNSNFDKIFILSMYKDLVCDARFCVKKNTFFP